MVKTSYPPVSSSSTPVSDIDLYSDEVLADPYPAFRVIRDTGPAVQLTANPVWVIARYADVRAALRDWRTFTSAEGVAMTDEMNAHMRGSVLASDPPEHGVLRGVLSEKLAPRALAKLSDEIGGRADAIVAEAVSKGTFDAVTDLSRGCHWRPWPISSDCPRRAGNGCCPARMPSSPPSARWTRGCRPGCPRSRAISST